MHQYFTPILIDNIQDQPISSHLKFYGKVSGSSQSDPSIIFADDSSGKVLVDTSAFKTQLYEKGETYRFFGEYRGLSDHTVPSLPVLRLLVPLRRVDGYNKESFVRAMSIRNDFMVGMDSLVAYASKKS